MTGILSLVLSIFFSFFFSRLVHYVERIKDLSRGVGQEVWCLPGKIRS